MIKINTLQKLFIALFISAITLNNSNAQSCGTDHYHDKWREANPHLENFDKIDPNYEHNTNRRNARYTIPVVFHVLHTNGAENISTEQIMDQLRILNEDFTGQNSDKVNIRNTANAPFAPLFANMEIEFVLAKKDPDGNCTNGINRLFTADHIDARDNVKNLIRWNVNRYLNIWVVSSIQNFDQGSSGTVLGFANFPWMPATTDGIVMRSDEIGSIGTGNRTRAGRTLSHEVGHYLGLYHTFQGGCSGGGDLVDDTPPVSNGDINRNCPANGNSCASSPLHDMWENYMDYSLGCQYMFSNGQKNRALFFVSSPTMPNSNVLNRRSVLATQENLEFTGVISSPNQKPIANFSSNIRLVCAGTPVSFYDNSCQGAVSQRTWNFPGGNITSSSSSNPTVIYSTPGVYKVKLSVGNPSGSSEIEVEDYIRVIPAIAEWSGIAESFEFAAEFSEWGVRNLEGDGIGKFEKTTTTAHFGNSSIVANITPTNTGTRYILELPYLDISKMSGQNPLFSFMTAYARRTSTNNDILRLYVSTDCGNTWTQRFQRAGPQLATNQNLVPNFVPQSISDWRIVVFNLSEFTSNTSLKLRIEVESQGGNPVYIDDINVSQFHTSVSQLARSIDAVVFPNPSNSTFNIEVSSIKDSDVEVTVHDLSGRLVENLYTGKIKETELNLSFEPRENNLTSGIYFLKIKTHEGILTKKLIFAD